MFAAYGGRTEAGIRARGIQFVPEADETFERRQRLAAQSRRWIADRQRKALQEQIAEAERLRQIRKERHHERLISMVAAWHGFTAADITGQSRVKVIVAARHDAIAAVYHQCRDRYGKHHSLPVLGRFFGGRDHTSILHSLRTTGMR